MLRNVDDAIKKQIKLKIFAEATDDKRAKEEHEQLAEWLEELKAYRENSNGYNKEDIELNRKAMYNKAIDDFAKKMKELCEVGEISVFGWNRIVDGIAEQLKAGDNNGT